MTYAEAIKKLRSKMLMTQTELAELLKVSFGSVNRWETGKYEPTMESKRKLRKLFIENGIKVEN